jgi:iron complex outermembrane receptor protein
MHYSGSFPVLRKTLRLWSVGCMVMILPLLLPGSQVSAQSIVQISGRVTDATTNEPMAGVNITIPDKYKGTISNNDGYFYLKVTGIELPFKIRISMVGYHTEEYQVTRTYESGIRVRMMSEDVVASEVVVTAPVIESEQKVFREVRSMERLDALGIKETPAHTYYEALAYLKGIDVTTQSLQFLTVNARGFNSTENLRFKQVVDGMDNQAPGFNFPIGNILGLNELDVESMEFLPGPSSAVYGNNSLNGVLELSSKDPFTYQGLSVVIEPGVADLRPGSDYPFQFFGKPLMDASIRYAKAYGNVAFKLNLAFMRGRDWYADDTVNVRAGSVHYEVDPGHDGLNQYGDEVMSYLPVGENGEMIPVARTGYRDKYLVDNRVKSLKLGAALHYSLTEKITAVLAANYGLATTVYAGDNRISLPNFQIYQAKAEIRSDRFLVRGYTTQQNSGDAYDTRFLAINLNRYVKSDDQWFKDFKNACLGRYRRFGIIGSDYNVARAFADNDRLWPGTAGFDEVKQKMIDSTGFYRGARIVNNSNLYEVDAEYRFKSEGVMPSITVGGNYRFFDLASEGTIFPDTTGNNITYFEYGSYIEMSKKMLNEKLDLVASLRYDKSENFQGQLTPRFSMLYSFSEYKNLRFSILTGARYPGTKEQFIHQNLGTAIYLGGLHQMFKPYDLPLNSFYYDKVGKFNQAVDNAVYDKDNPISQTQAIFENLSLLQDGIVRQKDFRDLRPEKVLSLELGYKSRIANSFFFDFVYYYSLYKDFIGYVTLAKPRTSPSTDLFTAASQVNNTTQRDLFYLYTNSNEMISLQGIMTGIKWLMPLGSVMGMNATLTKINQQTDDPVVPGFNTPALKVNLSISNRKLDKMPNNPGFKNLGFYINWRYQSPIHWESPFASGRIKQFGTTDFQLSYTFEKPKSVLKAGVNNFLNIIHTSSFGGPQIGIFYYVSYTIESLFE